MTARSEQRWQRQNRSYFNKPFGLAHLNAHPPVEQPATRLPTKAQVRRWMISNAEDHLDECGDLDMTNLVDTYCILNPCIAHWLDDPEHWIYYMAWEVGQKLHLFSD